MKKTLLVLILIFIIAFSFGFNYYDDDYEPVHRQRRYYSAFQNYHDCLVFPVDSPGMYLLQELVCEIEFDNNQRKYWRRWRYV